jgi:hypothetical protein
MGHREVCGDFMALDFKNLSPEQEKLLVELLKVCDVTLSIVKFTPDEILVRQAKEICNKMKQLKAIS